MSEKKRGFATFPPDKLREVSSRGGQRKSPTKGFAHLSPEERSANASRAAKERWRIAHEKRRKDG